MKPELFGECSKDVIDGWLCRGESITVVMHHSPILRRTETDQFVDHRSTLQVLSLGDSI